MEKRIRTSSQGEPLIATYLHNKCSRKGIPLAGNFELTSRCNFNCKMCYVHQNKEHHKELTAREWISLAETAKDKGMLFLLLTGGEPFMRKDFLEIYTAIRKMGVMVSINTNGSLISEEAFQVLRNHPPTRINISLYGASNDTYQKLCGNQSFEKVLSNIKRLKEEGHAVKINCSLTPYNVQDLEAVYAYGKELGVPVQTSTYMYPPVRVNGGEYGNAPARFTAIDAARYRLQCQEQHLTAEQLASMDFSSDGEDDCTDGSGEKMNCRAGKSAFWITWDGRMMPCGMFSSAGFDVREHGFDGAWNMLREQTNQIYLPAKCKNCADKKQCPICAAAALAESGDTKICPEYLCEMTKELKKITREKYGR